MTRRAVILFIALGIAWGIPYLLIKVAVQELGLLELPESTAPSPSTKGITKQAESLIARSAPVLRDQVVLSCALGNEHYEMSAYRSLIIPLSAMGMSDAVALLQANLEQETHTGAELEAALAKLAA